MCPSPSPRLCSNHTILCGGNCISLNVDLRWVARGGRSVHLSAALLAAKWKNEPPLPSAVRRERDHFHPKPGSFGCCGITENILQVLFLHSTDDHNALWIVSAAHPHFPHPLPGVGQGSLVCCSPWGHKESDMTERLNWTEFPSNTPVYIFMI